MSHYILDRAYEESGPLKIEPGLVVGFGEKDGTCVIFGDAVSPYGLCGVCVSRAVSARGKFWNIRKAGIARCIAGGRIPAGSRVSPLSDGRVVRAGDFGSEIVLGFAETTAVDAGDEVEVFISIHQRVSSA